MDERPDDLLTTGEACRVLGISQRTLTRYLIQGRLAAVYLPTGRRRFRRGDLAALVTRERSA